MSILFLKPSVQEQDMSFQNPVFSARRTMTRTLIVDHTILGVLLLISKTVFWMGLIMWRLSMESNGNLSEIFQQLDDEFNPLL